MHDTRVPVKHVLLTCGCAVPWEDWEGNDIPWVPRQIQCDQHGSVYIVELNEEDYIPRKLMEVHTPHGKCCVFERPTEAGDMAWWAHIPLQDSPIGPCWSCEEAMRYAQAGRAEVDVWGEAAALKDYLAPEDQKTIERLLTWAAMMKEGERQIELQEKYPDKGAFPARVRYNLLREKLDFLLKLPKSKWQTLRDVSRTTGVPHETLRTWLFRGSMKGIKDGYKLWRIDPLEVRRKQLSKDWAANPELFKGTPLLPTT